MIAMQMNLLPRRHPHDKVELPNTNMVDVNLSPLIEDDVSCISLVKNLNPMCRMRGVINDWDQLSVCILRDFDVFKCAEDIQEICVADTFLNSPRIEAIKN